MHSIQRNIANTMRMSVFVTAMISTLSAGTALADDQYNDTARVLSVTPQTERVNVPRQDCRTEYQQQSYSNNNPSIAGAVIGGVAGGLLGNTIGRGNGRVAAAAVGAGIGALAGDRINNNNGGNARSVPIQSCYQVDNWQTVNSGYLVSYEYNGRTYTTVMNNPPGSTIDVNVAVAPVRQTSQYRRIEPIRYTEPGWSEESRGRGNRYGWNKRRGYDDDSDGRYY